MVARISRGWEGGGATMGCLQYKQLFNQDMTRMGRTLMREREKEGEV